MKKIFLFTFSLVFAFSMANPSVLAQEAAGSNLGPLGHWDFDESSWAGNCLTADIIDSSGNNRHGIACINGDAPFPVPGKFGNAGSFDGINQYANMGPGFNFTSSFTASLWIALDDYNSCGPTGSSQHIIGTHHLRTPTGKGRGWGIYWDCDGLAWELTNSTGSAIASYGYVQPSPFPANGSWHHAALVYDSTIPSATLYWDGVPIYSESGTANVPGFLYSNGEPLTINGLPYAPGAGAPGKIDDTRVFDRALSHTEIQFIYGDHPPAAVDDVFTTDEDTPLNVAAPGVLDNDTDPDGDTLIAVLDGGPDNGTLSLNANGSFIYTPNANFNGSDSFTYLANDGSANSNIATVTIVVKAVNDPPAAVDDAYTTDEDTPLNVAAPGVLDNDTDPDGDTLIAVLDGGPGNGTLSLNANGSFIYTPNANFNGTDGFSYTVSDGNGGVNSAYVTVIVNAINDMPVVSILTPAYGSSFTKDDSISFTGIASDVEDGDLTSSLSWSSNLDGLIGTGGSFSTTALSVGTHTVMALTNDFVAQVGTDQIIITVTPAETTVDALANGEISVAGTVSGDYFSTHGDDGNLESITERESGGKLQKRYSYLEHKWTFSVTPGNTVTVYANAWSGGSNDSDSFIFAYSIDDVNYVEMFTVDNTSDDTIINTYILPASIQGIVYLRVTDSNHSSGNQALDTVFVDYLHILSETQPGVPPDGPTGLVATSISSSHIDLTWTDKANDETGFYIERSLDGANWSQIGAAEENVTNYSDTTVSPTTIYYYRIRAFNGSGSSAYSNIASTITPSGLILFAQGYKVKGVQTVDLFWNGDSGTFIDVYRDGELVGGYVVGNAFTDNIGFKGGGRYEYQVCEAGGTTNCSNTVQVDF